MVEYCKDCNNTGKPASGGTCSCVARKSVEKPDIKKHYDNFDLKK